MTNSKDETSAMERAPAELMADPMLKLWHLLDAAKTEWLASDEPCDEKTALARAILAADWRPPLPACDCEPFTACPHIEQADPNEQAAIQLGYCEASVQASSDPEDGEQCPNLREPGYVNCHLHRSSPLPDSETEWGCRDRHGRVHSVGVENEAQARSMRSMTPVRREVGPWIEVTS